jgi:hypothetical protein
VFTLVTLNYQIHIFEKLSHVSIIMIDVGEIFIIQDDKIVFYLREDN